MTKGRDPRKRGRAAQAAGRQKAGLLLLAVLAGALVVWGLTQTDRAGTAANPLPGVESFPSEGRDHVPVGTRVAYRTDPPTSGPHYPAPVAPGFYETELPAEALVHNLEHGHIVIYYDPDRMTAEEREALRALTDRYRGDWDAVVAVPRPQAEAPFILTAWTKMLRLNTFDAEAVAAFLDAYRGRGPENPVR